MLAGQGGHGQLPGSSLTFPAIGQWDRCVRSQAGGRAGSRGAVFCPCPPLPAVPWPWCQPAAHAQPPQGALVAKRCSWVLGCKGAFVGSDLSLVADLWGLRSPIPLFLKQNFSPCPEIRINVRE